MTYATVTLDEATPFTRDPAGRRAGAGTLALVGGLAAAVLVLGVGPTVAPTLRVVRGAVPARVSVNPFGPLLAPGYALGYAAQSFAQSAPLGPRFVTSAPAAAPAVLASAEPVGASPPPPAPLPAPAPIEAAAPAAEPAAVPFPMPAPPRLAEAVPLPLPRPAGLHPRPGQDRARLAGRGRLTVVARAPVDNRSFFEKLFGGQEQPASGPALAYAAPESNLFGSARRLTSAPMIADGARTAIYDISAHTVYMPDGSRLEAHSGLGSRLDDPRFVHERMRGPTPPHLYDLKPREALFHGVRALRLTPIGEGGIYGRDGLLAHTYMLGPNGDSNGCVSFRDYDAFLRAFANGQVTRLAVVVRR